jgi:hypothetical protein
MDKQLIHSRYTGWTTFITIRFALGTRDGCPGFCALANSQRFVALLAMLDEQQ